MILCAAPSPAWDVTYHLDRLRLGETNRARSVSARAGGKAASELAATSGSAVAVSLGPDGLAITCDSGTWLARPGEVVHGNPTGAGDAVTAVRAPYAGEVDLRHVDRLDVTA